MVYLDYSATTPVNEEVLNSFNKVCHEFIGNPNSLHKLGIKSKQLEENFHKFPPPHLPPAYRVLRTL